MKELVALSYLLAAGLIAGFGVYHASNPGVPEFKESMTWPTTFTGPGQSRCQTGC